jgi:CheY-like chemotaxis protein
MVTASHSLPRYSTSDLLPSTSTTLRILLVDSNAERRVALSELLRALNIPHRDIHDLRDVEGVSEELCEPSTIVTYLQDYKQNRDLAEAVDRLHVERKTKVLLITQRKEPTTATAGSGSGIVGLGVGTALEGDGVWCMCKPVTARKLKCGLAMLHHVSPHTTARSSLATVVDSERNPLPCCRTPKNVPYPSSSQAPPSPASGSVDMDSLRSSAQAGDPTSRGSQDDNPDSVCCRHPNSRILIVDDVMMNRRVLQLKLQEAGYKNVSLASSGVEALQRIEQAAASTPSFVYDVILMDVWTTLTAPNIVPCCQNHVILYAICGW